MNGNGSRLSIREKVGYGLGDFASVLYWQTLSFFLLYFYTDIFGITAAAAGTMILFSRLWDGVNDPMMGIIADRTETRWGKFRPYLVWMAVPMGVIAVATFSTPDLGPTGKLVYAWITYFLFMMAYTAINIPYSSLLGVITPDPEERTTVSLYKYWFAYLSAGLAPIASLPLAEKLIGKNDKAFGWQMTVIIFAVFATILFYLTFISTNERVRPPKTQKTSITRDLRDLLQNQYWGLLLLTSLFMILFVATRLTVTAHYFKYYVGEQSLTLFGETYTFGFVSLTPAFMAFGGWMPLAGVIATKWIAKALGKKKTFIMLYIISAASTGVFYFVEPHQLGWMFGLRLIDTFTGGPLTPLLWAMFADCADYSEWKNGRRATGLVFSASTMSQKIGWAVGTFVAGMLLTTMGFEANVEQTQEVKDGLRLLMSIIPAAAGGVATVLMVFYKLDEKKMKRIAADLAERRKTLEEVESKN
jgi:GPH family glycoside/pentoside/hexuronide:cation symporter